MVCQKLCRNGVSGWGSLKDSNCFVFFSLGGSTRSLGGRQTACGLKTWSNMSTSRLPHKDFRSHGSDWRANYQVIQRSYRKSLSSSIDDHVPYLCWITRRGFPQFSLVYHCDMWWFLTAETNSRQRRWTLATSKLKFGTVHQWGFPQMESSLKWKYPKSSSPIQSFDHDFVLKQPRLICGSVSKKFKKCIKWWFVWPEWYCSGFETLRA